MPKKSGNKVEARRPRISPSGYQLPDPITPGEVLTDAHKKQWKLGTSIGTGGFGEIYRASDDITRPVSNDTSYVIKIEPHSNGPLFTEMHVYQNAAKIDTISEWMKKKSLKFLGMPKFITHGSHEYKGTKYRFLVVEKFGDDLQKLFEAEKKKFSAKTVLTIGIKVLDTLEYFHQTGYIHADIKASNLLRGPTAARINEIYLVDFGLACRYCNKQGEHKEFKEDPRKAHDGTIEFTSRDAHIGAHSRRGDLEILGYNMIQWLCSKLPWEDNLKDQNYVQREKEKYMKAIPQFVKKCLKNSPVQDVMQSYLEHVASLDFTTEPNYKLCRDIFIRGLKKIGAINDGKLEFTSDKPAASKPRGRTRKATSSNEDEETENIGEAKPAKAPRSSPCQPCRPAQTNRIRKTAAASSNRSRKNSKTEEEKDLAAISATFDNPTPAMLEIIRKKNLMKRPVPKQAAERKSRSPSSSPPKRKRKESPVKKAAAVATRTTRPKRSRSPVKSADVSPELF